MCMCTCIRICIYTLHAFALSQAEPPRTHHRTSTQGCTLQARRYRREPSADPPSHSSAQTLPAYALSSHALTCAFLTLAPRGHHSPWHARCQQVPGAPPGGPADAARTILCLEFLVRKPLELQHVKGFLTNKAPTIIYSTPRAPRTPRSELAASNSPGAASAQRLVSVP